MLSSSIACIIKNIPANAKFEYLNPIITDQFKTEKTSVVEFDNNLEMSSMGEANSPSGKNILNLSVPVVIKVVFKVVNSTPLRFIFDYIQVCFDMFRCFQLDSKFFILK